MTNRYLRDRASSGRSSSRGSRSGSMSSGRGSSRDRDMARRDGRNPYGSRGGYVVSSRGRGRGRGRDREMEDMYYQDRERDYAMDGHYPREMGYEMYGMGAITPMHEMYDYRDMRGGSRGRMRGRDYGDYGMDYGDYDYEDYASDEEMEEEYKEDLKEWIKKMKPKDRFGMTKEQTIQHAKQMGVKFEEFSEEEFYAIFLAMLTDYKDISNDPTIYIRLAKDFLEDDDIAVSPSEKVCIYLYEIVKGGK